MTDLQIVEYLRNGGILFRIKAIDMLRDDGTQILETNGGTFSVHKHNKTFHKGPTPNDKNLITDPSLIEYLIHSIGVYIRKCKKEIEQSEKLLLEVQVNNSNTNKNA